jgi:hypothetical protein
MMMSRTITVRLKEHGGHRGLFGSREDLARDAASWAKRLLREDGPPAAKAGPAEYDDEDSDDDDDSGAAVDSAAGGDSPALDAKRRLGQAWSEDEDDADIVGEFRTLLKKYRRTGGRPQEEARQSTGYSPGGRSRREKVD